MNNLYACPYCSVQHDSIVLQEHIRIYHPFVCSYCDKQLSSNHSLIRHIKSCHPEKYSDDAYSNDLKYKRNIGCSYCNKRYAYYISLKRHIKTCHPEKYSDDDDSNDLKNIKNISCSYCNKQYTNKTLLKRHIKTCHPKKNLNNASCNDLKYIKNIISTDEDSLQLEFVCKICKRKFSNEKIIKNHIKRVHDNELQYQCNICDNVYKFKNSVFRHIAEVHSVVNDINSHIIPTNKSKGKEKGYNNEDSSNSNIYTDSKMFIECEYCNKTYSSKGIKRHLRTKHSLPPTRKATIQCYMENCEIVVSRLYQLREHLMSPIEDGGHMIIEVENKYFDDMQAFNQWKDEIEIKENIRYRLRKKCDKSFMSHYYCSRSGRYSYGGANKRKSKSTGTTKINASCPSTITISIKCDGRVACTYYKTHGHEITVNDIVHIRIHKRDKEFIAEKLRQGVDPKKIRDDLHSRGGRSALIKHKDIINQMNRIKKNEYTFDNHELGKQDDLNLDNDQLNKALPLPLNNYEMDEQDSITPESNEIGQEASSTPESYEKGGAPSLTINVYEMDEHDSLTRENNDRAIMYKEAQTTLTKLTNALHQHSNSTDYIKKMKQQLKTIEDTLQLH